MVFRLNPENQPPTRPLPPRSQEAAALPQPTSASSPFRLPEPLKQDTFQLQASPFPPSTSPSAASTQRAVAEKETQRLQQHLQQLQQQVQKSLTQGQTLSQSAFAWLSRTIQQYRKELRMADQALQTLDERQTLNHELFEALDKEELFSLGRIAAMQSKTDLASD